MQNHGLVFNRNKLLEIVGYTDASFADDPDMRRLMTGWVFMMCGALISWCSKKQSLVTLSTTEAEYVSACKATQEAIWLKNLLNEIAPLVMQGTIQIFKDNQGCIKMSKNPINLMYSKHIRYKYHFICQVM